MKSTKYAVCILTALALLLSVKSASGREYPTITIQNLSDQTALIKFIGPTGGYLTVESSGSRTSQVRRGRYQLFIRYGTPSHYAYTKLDSFDVVKNEYQVSVITIVLHTTSGNTNERPSDRNEFDNQ